MKERRRWPRAERALEIRYFSAKDPSKANYTVSKDISNGGIRIPCSGLINDNDIIDLDLDLRHGRPAISAAARVAWTKKLKRPALLDLEAGLEFTREYSNKVRSFIKKL